MSLAFLFVAAVCGSTAFAGGGSTSAGNDNVDFASGTNDRGPISTGMGWSGGSAGFGYGASVNPGNWNGMYGGGGLFGGGGNDNIKGGTGNDSMGGDGDGN